MVSVRLSVRLSVRPSVRLYPPVFPSSILESTCGLLVGQFMPGSPAYPSYCVYFSSFANFIFSLSSPLVPRSAGYALLSRQKMTDKITEGIADVESIDSSPEELLIFFFFFKYVEYFAEYDIYIIKIADVRFCRISKIFK